MNPSFMRRVLAVFIDFLVVYAAWAVFGALIRVGSFYYALGFFFVLDVGLTAFLGLSLGRWITGIRVARVDGGRPGLLSALIRTALVFLTWWAGLLVFLVTAVLARLGFEDLFPSRMWWDAAARTRLVPARAYDPSRGQ